MTCKGKDKEYCEKRGQCESCIIEEHGEPCKIEKYLSTGFLTDYIIHKESCEKCKKNQTIINKQRNITL